MVDWINKELQLIFITILNVNEDHSLIFWMTWTELGPPQLFQDRVLIQPRPTLP